MKLETVRLEVADFIATVTIDRPPVNAQNQTGARGTDPRVR